MITKGKKPKNIRKTRSIENAFNEGKGSKHVGMSFRVIQEAKLNRNGSKHGGKNIGHSQAIRECI